MRVLQGLSLLILGLGLPAIATDHTAPPIQPATAFAAVEVHDKEKVAIAAEPYDTSEKESIFRVDYLGHGIMPVRLIVTNNGDHPALFRNDGGNRNHWLEVRLIGARSNRDGIGAVVRIVAGGEKQWQMLHSGSSYLSQSELVLTFGLGTRTKTGSVEVSWPSGQVDKLANVAADQTVTLQEGKGLSASRSFSKRSQ